MMNYENIYEIKKKYLDIISNLENTHQNIYFIITNDDIKFTKNCKKVHFDLENIPNHTWLKIKEYVDNCISKNDLEKKTNYSI
jgi:hypothetical protein